MFFKHFELGVLFIQLMSQSSADDICQHGLKSLFIAIIFSNWVHTVVPLASFCIRLLAHHSYGLVRSLNGHCLDVTNWNSIDHLCL